MNPRAGQAVRSEITTILSPGNLAEIYAHAAREFPRECCGFILADGVRRARNVIDELHAADPESFERSSATGYALSVEDALFLDGSFDTPRPVLAVYHSHPNGHAYFSEEDTRRALHCGEPVYPDLLQLVVGIDESGVREARLFAFLEGGFTELAHRAPHPHPTQSTS
ncbi:Mov34/MPN/PAD-1 family protein [Streptomyces sp. YGL11-2]|uniref:Mov34/MPN/PAD-1 family protein n=1 Tax=Streptomyces sp. YGL11-2 TaxID=3414028 RepID=UPI003CE973FE